MNDLQIASAIVAVTGVLRTRFPKIDGLFVPLVAVLVGAALAALNAREQWGTALVHGVGVGLTAVGGMHAIGYAGRKFGSVVAATRTIAVSDTTPTPHTAAHVEHDRSRSGRHRS